MVFGLSLEETAKLHGHKGPWLVLGYRAGRRAREILNPLSEHDLYCIVYVPLKTPYTCIIDGVQGSTSCTLGKQNVEIKESSSDNIRIVFINRKTSRKLEMKLKENVEEEINKLYEKYGLDGAAKWVEGEQLCRLFEEKLYG